MPWVRFTADYDWRVNTHTLIAYRAGKSFLVSQACAKAAIDKGKAIAVPRPQRSGQQMDASDAGQ